jgi:hypothetical protein
MLALQGRALAGRLDASMASVVLWAYNDGLAAVRSRAARYP